MSNELLVDVEALRTPVRDKHREVANDPHGAHHFHTGRPLASRLGYEDAIVAQLPDRAVESFAAVGNPFPHILRPCGVLQFADTANVRPVPIHAMPDVDRWTG